MTYSRNVKLNLCLPNLYYHKKYVKCSKNSCPMDKKSISPQFETCFEKCPGVCTFFSQN